MSPSVTPPPRSLPLRVLRRLLTLASPSLWVLGWAALVALLLAIAVNWLLRYDSGTAWLLARVPGVQAEGLQGALLSERWQLRRLRVQVGARVQAVVIEDLDAQGVRWRWDTRAPRWLTLQVTRLSASQVRLDIGPPGTGEVRVPSALQLPLGLDVGHLAVAELRIGELPPFTGIQATVGMDADAQGHRVDDLQVEWDRLRGRGSARLQSLRPFALQGRARIGPADGDSWSADVQAEGTLERLSLQAALRARLDGGRDTPSLDARALVEPFAPWALTALNARTEALDLSTLASALPRTRLAGSADLHTRGLQQPFTAELKFDNTAAGRWDEQRLPVRRAELSLKASLQARDVVELQAFDLLLANNGGQWRGRGRWSGDTLQLDSQIAELRPHLLDQRAPRLQASGPLAMVLRGLEVPGSQPSARTTAAARAPLTLEIKTTLDGRVDGAAQPAQLQLDAVFGARQVELRQVRASAGAALAQGQAMAQRRGDDTWQVSSRGTLADFDPRLWWPGAEGSAWRQGPHRFNGDWQLEFSAPQAAATPLGWLQRVAGNGALRLRDSVLAGVPATLELSLAQPAASAGGDAAATVQADVVLGGNRLVLKGQARPDGNGSTDRWQAELKAGTLATWAPLARLSEDLAPWAPRDGSAVLSVQAEGRWPDLRTSGQLQLDRVRLGELTLQAAQGRWGFDTRRDQPLEAQLEVTNLRQGRQGLDQARLSLLGTLREHRLQLDAALPVRPPAWLEELLGTQTSGGVPSTGTRAQLSADGQWLGDGSGGGSWRGRVATLRAQDWDPRQPARPAGTAAPLTWLDASDLRAELRFSAEGGLTELRAEPARVRLADALTLRWDAVRVDMRPSTPDFTLRAEIEPFAAAPVLARLQPGAGWGGDLQLAASVDLRAAARFDADIVFERRSGDLVVDDGLGRQHLGLSSLRLVASAHDGLWRFTPQVAGRTLGEVTGSLLARTQPHRRWPDAAATLDGAIEARVSDIGIWGTWVPPGWRLVGAVNTSAAIGGSLDAPQYTGTLQGRGIGVRNLLQGVDVAGGDVLVSLKGDRAVIEQFRLKGGDGELRVQGGAEFGAQPVARVQLQAERFRVLGRVDRQLTVSGQAALELARDRLRLDGQARVDSGLFDASRRDAPSLDEDVVMRGADAGVGTADTAEPARPVRRSSQVSLQVDLGEKLRVRGRGLDTLLSGQLRLTTPEGRPHLTGIVRAVDGTYVGYGQKLDIERGLLSFSGPPENPSLDILALRQNVDARVGLAIVGSLVNPRVRLYSDPEMSETEKLSWLVLGRPSDGLGRADTALLQRAAVALLAGEGEAPTDSFLRRIGLDELSLRQGDSEVRETVITLGKQLSRRWYLGYERSVNATSGTWQLIYRIAQRFTLRAQTGHENSLDLIWVWRRGEAPFGVPASKP